MTISDTQISLIIIVLTVVGLGQIWGTVLTNATKHKEKQ